MFFMIVNERVSKHIKDKFSLELVWNSKVQTHIIIEGVFVWR